jgi:hypothetical protein
LRKAVDHFEGEISPQSVISIDDGAVELVDAVDNPEAEPLVDFRHLGLSQQLRAATS